MLPNLEIIGWKKFPGLSKLDEAVAESNLAVNLNSIIFKLDKHVVL